MKNAYCDVQSTTMHTPLKSLRYYYNCWTYHSPDPWDLLVYLIKPHLLIFCNVSKWIKWGRLNWRKGGILQKVSRMTIRHQTPLIVRVKALIVKPNLFTFTRRYMAEILLIWRKTPSNQSLPSDTPAEEMCPKKVKYSHGNAHWANEIKYLTRSMQQSKLNCFKHSVTF